MSALLLLSPGRVFRWVRSNTDLTLQWQRAVVLVMLQGYADVIPLIAILLQTAHDIVKWVRMKFDALVNNVLFPGFISVVLMFLLHEMPQLVAPSYLSFLRVVSGASRPVLNLHFTDSHSGSSNVIPYAASSLVVGASFFKRFQFHTNLAEYSKFFTNSYLHTLRMFTIIYLIVRPIFRGFKRPEILAPLHAMRTSLWISITGSIGFLAGKLNVAGHPYLTTFLRLSMAFFGALVTAIESPAQWPPIFSFLVANVLYSLMKLIEAVHLSQFGVELPMEKIVSVFFPVLALFGFVNPGPLTAAVINTL